MWNPANDNKARDEDKIKRKIVEKLATFTTYPICDDVDTDESVAESATDSLDPELLLASGSDSSVEGKVVATSVDGEEGLVDITMKETSNAPKPNTEISATSGPQEPAPWVLTSW